MLYKTITSKAVPQFNSTQGKGQAQLSFEESLSKDVRYRHTHTHLWDLHLAEETRVLTTHGSTMLEAAATAASATTAGILAALPVVLPTLSALAAKGFRTRGTH